MIRRFDRTLQLLTLALVVALPTRGIALDPSEPEPWLSDDQELLDAGWQFVDTGRQSGSVWGGILASTVGTVVHGVGHLYAGDTRTGTALLISEGVSLGLVAGGLLTQSLSNNDGGLSGVYRPLLVIGVGLFATSWLLDVIGTFKGTSLSLPERARSLRHLRLGLGYSHLVGQGVPLRHVMSMDLAVDFGWFFLRPQGQVGFDEEYFSMGAATGLRFGFGRRPFSFVDLTLEGKEVIAGDRGYAFESLVVSVGLSLDLGDIFAHLAGLIYQNRIGFGTQLLRFAFDQSSPLNADNAVNLLVVEVSLNARILDPLVLGVGYIQRPDTLVPNLSRSLGAFFATLAWELPAGLEWYVDVRIGNGAQLMSGISYDFDRYLSGRIY